MLPKIDYTCLGENCCYKIDENLINGNELILGSTGAGKTMSISEPRILHTYNRSLVIPISKRTLYDKYAPILKERGYEIWDLNLENTNLSKVGYDPCRNIHNELDILNLAKCVQGNTASYSLNGEMDPYWSEATISSLAAEIGLIYENSNIAKKAYSFSEVLTIHKYLELDITGSHCKTNLDDLFEKILFYNKNSQAPRLWKTLSGNSPKTSACIYSMMNNALDKLCTKEIERLFTHKKQICISDLGKRKIALFITTSPVNTAIQKLTDILYGDIFRELYLEAGRNKGILKVPVHVICDDFACGSTIPEFDKYISSFRSLGISVTILLQSLSQLPAVYGNYAGKTIENNCDTIVFLGSLDIETCKEISIRTGQSLDDILSMPIGKAIISRRGQKTIITNRYPILEDELYKKYFS